MFLTCCLSLVWMLVWQLEQIKQDTMNSNRGVHVLPYRRTSKQQLSKTSATDVHGVRPQQPVRNCECSDAVDKPWDRKSSSANHATFTLCSLQCFEWNLMLFLSPTFKTHLFSVSKKFVFYFCTISVIWSSMRCSRTCHSRLDCLRRRLIWSCSNENMTEVKLKRQSFEL